MGVGSTFGPAVGALSAPGERYTESQKQALGDRGLFGFLPETDVTVGGTVNQVMQGFVSGFTGFTIGEDPENTTEAIARSIGGVAGFLGFVPGPGLAGKFGAQGVARAFGAARLAERIGQGGAAFRTVRSVPLMFADSVIGAASKIGKNNAFLSSVKLLNNSRAADTIIEGARIGLAHGFYAP